MNPILQGLEAGFGEEEILSYLSKAIPKLGNTIKKATKSGYRTKEILGFLSKNFDTESLKGKSESQIHSINQRADAERAKYGLKLAATAVTAPLAASAARSALSRALPNSLKNLSTALTSTGLGQQQPQSGQSSQLNAAPDVSGVSPMEQTQQMPLGQGQLQNASQQPPVNKVEETIPQPTNIQQPKQLGLQTPEEKRLNTLKGFKNKKASAIQRELERVESEYGEIDPNESAHGLAKKAQIPYEKANELIQAKRDAEILEEPKPIKEITKGSLTASPMGMGEVKELRNGSALIDVDGKIHKVSEEDLIESPLPQKELADLYDDLIGGIEKTTGQQVSRNVDWAGYDPKTNELAYKPHGSDKLYAYDNISPEDIEVLTGFLTQRKSTGDNYIGAWEKGSTSPIGAAMYQLIQKLQKERGGKGNEYKNRYDTIYDSLESAKKAAKKRHAERKKEAKKSRAR